MKDQTILAIVKVIGVTIVVSCFLMLIAWISTPTDFDLDISMNDHALEAFKIAYNTTNKCECPKGITCKEYNLTYNKSELKSLNMPLKSIMWQDIIS